MTDPAAPAGSTTLDYRYPPPPSPPPPRDRNVVKIALLIVGGVVVAFVALIAAVVILAWRATYGPADAADRFLAKTAAQGPAAAWRTGSPALRQSGSEADWNTFARRNALTSFRKSHWRSREIRIGSGRVSGTVETARGAVPLTIELVQSGDRWQVQRVTGVPSGFTTAPDVRQSAVRNVAWDF